MTERLLAVLLLAAFTAGCTQASRGVRATDAARHIVPQSSSRSQTGTLVAHVHGTPREIEYRVNGTRIESSAPLSKDAQLELELRPGRYSLEARYKVRLFAGESTEYRIVTREPVDVLPGQTTHLVADLEKDWRGVPLRAVTHFEVREPGTKGPEDHPTGTQFSSRKIPIQLELPEVDQTNADAYREELRSPAPDPNRADFIVIRGDTPATDDRGALGGSGIRLEPVGGVSRPRNHIVIRGDQVISEDASAPVPRPPVSQPTPEFLPPPAAVSTPVPVAELEPKPTPEFLPPLAAVSTPAPVAELEPKAARPFDIEIRIESEPTATDVRLDDVLIGRTPLRVHVDPRQDHLIAFERAGCDPYVMLLSQASWERGRSPVVRGRLDCP